MNALHRNGPADRRHRGDVREAPRTASVREPAAAREMQAKPVVAKRLVFHVGGYDPPGPETVHRRFMRELRRFVRTWSANASASEPEIGADLAAWRVATSGPNWRVETDCRLVRWDDVIAAAGREPLWRRVPHGLLACLGLIAGGALWGYFRTNWRYALFFLYPFLLFAALAALAATIGMRAADATGWGVVGAAAGALALVLLLTWAGRKLHLWHLFDDWIFAHSFLRRGDPVLDARLDRIAHEIGAAARNGAADEILIVGHSLGAVLAVDLVDRALRLDPALGQDGPRVAFVSVGSSILKLGLHRGAKRLHAAAARVASAPGVFWAEYQALTDVMNFYKTDPVAAMGLAPTGRPVIRVVRISRMLDSAFYRRIRRNFFRVHNQFVSANDKRAAYDYFMLLCGPLPAERQAGLPEGAASAIGPDGALLDEPGLVEPVPACPAEAG